MSGDLSHEETLRACALSAAAIVSGNYPRWGSTLELAEEFLAWLKTRESA